MVYALYSHLQQVAELVASEFFEQGDMERSEYSSDPIVMNFSLLNFIFFDNF